MKTLKLLIIIIIVFIPFYSYSCIKCHKGIEQTSPSHNFACVICHGGNDKTDDKNLAHKNMIGGRNPSNVKNWDKSCGKCHEYNLKRVKNTIMYTNTGIIKNAILAWGENFSKIYSTSNSQTFDSNGHEIITTNVSKRETLAGELYRKFCSMCHVGVDRLLGYRAHHSSGCAACHFSHDRSGKYLGKDKSILGKKGYAKTHKMNILPGNDTCLRCHHRSGRIALSYEGYYDGNNSLVPTKYGLPGPDLISGVRNIRHMPEDIHKKYGMECIDCHTSRELMGDGYLYENLYNQIEISCEDCHGSPNSRPKTAKITKESDPPIIESKHYKVKLHYGQNAVLTSKGRMYSNVIEENGKYYLFTKRTGKKLEIKTITNDDNHTVYGHEKLECYTCHSKVIIQCYGCHTFYDKRKKMFDVIKGKETDGLFYEKEDYRSFYPFPLAVNQKGKISPSTPGCQTFLTVIDKNGHKTTNDDLIRLNNKKVYKFAPFFGHNVGDKAISCMECHNTLFFVGFGDGLVSLIDKSIKTTIRCSKLGKPLNAINEIANGKLTTTSKIVRETSRPLKLEEIKRYLRANLCIICHDKGDKKIYGKKIDYSILNDTIHKQLLGSGK
ncbi:multiheme c-type cytochrome [Deferribacter desulfuricans SSM1]|uniref:Multiheme c-type cytochrome n=1 Tax=Deferribacter desulfuricans (strain DSM 14783 / JCM 11476 / NBRC 101012 / SSM1) TaxID=639282 RepID=D3PC23_DEFDS|nr:selenite/tellurite reduction operon c-type cytochrome ExtM [Deferribacter desulfuricans]BAI80146.1 multiheme c-type cytochrome [Deferribacter desulfuricans SSM1]